jgi:hypothetical protein
MSLIPNGKVLVSGHQGMQIFPGHRHKFPRILQSTTGLISTTADRIAE